MTLKQRIINEFMADEKRNFTAYATNSNELGKMYDLVVEYSKLPQKDWFYRLLVEQRAMASSGKIRFDRETVMYDKELKKDIPVKVVFKYSVFNYLNNRRQEGLDAIKERDLSGLEDLKNNKQMA